MARILSLYGLVAVTYYHTLAQGLNTRELFFSYEEIYLTDKTLQNLIETKGFGDDAYRFGFDNGTDLIPDRLKSGTCKIFPGDAEWPPQATWESFDNLLGGSLIKTIPVAAPCYQNLGVYDAEKCTAVRNNFTNQHFQLVPEHQKR